MCLKGEIPDVGGYRYQASRFISGDQVSTSYGSGTVIALRIDGIIEVELDTWKLMGGASVTLYLNEASLMHSNEQSASTSESDQIWFGDADILLKKEEIKLKY